MLVVVENVLSPVRCRCKQALVELRHLKSKAREATKLLEDKKVLEVKVCANIAVICGAALWPSQ